MTSLNECCYKCPYSTDKRPGDITIGDYEWGKNIILNLVNLVKLAVYW